MTTAPFQHKGPTTMSSNNNSSNRNNNQHNGIWVRRLVFFVAYAYLPIHILTVLKVYLTHSSTQLPPSHATATLAILKDFVEWQSQNSTLIEEVQELTTTTVATQQLLKKEASVSPTEATEATQQSDDSSQDDVVDSETQQEHKENDSMESFHPFAHHPAPTSPFAYAFVLGGIHEDRHAYKGFLFDVLIATRLLKHKLNSTADVWVFTQLSPDSQLTTLPTDDRKLFEALDIRIQELPKPQHESFAQLVYHKFRLLQMTQYKRVMFLDADVMPVMNLDYLFHLSMKEPSVQNDQEISLRPNLILATRGEPCNTGVFMVAPQEGDWERLQAIVARQHEEAKNLPYPHFDWTKGWGHSFEEHGDVWEGTVKYGTKWKFHAGHSDQGLMYYWAKYVKQDVSIVIGDRLQNWIPSPNSSLPQLAQEWNQTFDEFMTAQATPRAASLEGMCLKPKTKSTDFHCFAPYRDFVHFMGGKKPWQQTMGNRIRNHNFYSVWFKELVEISRQIDDTTVLNVTYENWNDIYLPLMKESPLGYAASYQDWAKMVHHHNNKTKDTTKADQVANESVA